MGRVMALFVFAWLAWGQSFDAASIKPAPMPTGRVMLAGPSGGPGTNDPGRIRYPFISLRNLLVTAYDVKSLQIQGPDWLDSERFEVNATMPPATTKEQFRQMLQNLLTERFRMKTHWENKELPTYSLAVSKGGPKMKEAAPASDENNEPSQPPTMPPKIGADGFPVMPPEMAARRGLFLMMMPGRARLTARAQTMADLAGRLTDLLKRPVIDTTGLTTKYDFTVSFSAEELEGPRGMPSGPGMAVPVAPPVASGGGALPAAGNPVEPDTLPNVFTALKEQLGLTLDGKKTPVKVIVIDHIEKTPRGN